MTPQPLSSTADLLQTNPTLSVLRLAALTASPKGELDEETLDLMFERVENDAFGKIDPKDVWAELELGLMGQVPSNMFRSLHACGALNEILPEVVAVFGVPQIADDPPQVDIGLHMLRVLDQAALCEAPLAVRFAALVMHSGKSDSPPEHLPIHYRHVERGEPRIEAICRRFGVPDDCRELALLALSELERVHRVSDIRAGPVAAMLDRLGAFDRPERFEQLLLLCTCDYRAYRSRPSPDYPKAKLLESAVQACTGLEPGAADLQDARAQAIAKAFGSVRWSN